MYFRELCKMLDRERPGWRKDTILLLDGAPYHLSRTTMAAMEKLRIPVCFLGPHSYNTAPAELVFAALKRGHLNPMQKQTGRK